MFCAANKKPSQKAFTLLEVILAVVMLALITVTLYRFVLLDLTAIQVATDATYKKTAIQSLVAVLGEEFSNLSPLQQSALLGEAHMFNNKSSDQVTWFTQAGNGLFTEQADGPWQVTLQLRVQEKSSSFVLGLLREVPGNTDPKAEHWLALLPDVDAIEIRYFDHRLNAWLEKWSDIGTRPNLVRIRIWRKDETVPYEAILTLAPTRLPA